LDRMIGIAATQEVGVQRMHRAPFDGAISRHQGLAEHLAAEHAAKARIEALAPKAVGLEALQAQQLENVGEQRIHADQPDTPRRLCMIGLVVVYCSGIFFEGFKCSATANAASAASWKPERISFFLPGYVLISPTAKMP